MLLMNGIDGTQYGFSSIDDALLVSLHPGIPATVSRSVHVSAALLV